MRVATTGRDLEASRRSDASAERWSLLIAIAVTVVIGWWLPHEPDRVTVTIGNPTDHRLYVTASTPDDDTLTFVAIVSPRATGTMPEVIDRGSDWVLHLRTLGAPAGTMHVSRTDLVSGSMVIPLSINDDLAAAGVPVDVKEPDAAP